MKREALKCLTENILPFWLDNMQDNEHGGWYGRMDGRGRLHPQADKGAILNARILWSFSAAYRVLRDEAEGQYQDLCERCLAAGTMTKDYFLRHFVDRQHGGVFWSVDNLGRPRETKKQTYAIGFAVYGLSEYARATADSSNPDLRRQSAEALQAALCLYDDIERHASDPVFGGYIEACTRDWQPIADMRLSEKDENYPKSQNTHLHIIEPYTNLLRALQTTPSPSALSDNLPVLSSARFAGVERQLREEVSLAIRKLLSLFEEKILNPTTHHLDLFFQMDWMRMSTTASYGHDIECSWLLHEAALVLGDEAVLRQVEPVVKQVAAASEEGLLPCGAMIHENGDDDLHWWVQAEAVVGFLNLYQHFGDRAALDKAMSCFRFIQDHLIDRQHGEWFWSLRPDERVRPAGRDIGYVVNLDDDHAGFWKCPYHNSRMCLEIIERCKVLLK